MVITELLQTSPKISIIIISIIMTFISTIITKWLTNQEHLRSLKKRQKELQKEIKNCKDGCKMQEMQAEILSITGSMMKSSFKPVFITMIPFLILIYWIKSIYTPLMGFNWFWYYLGAAIISSIIYRKLLNMA